jgi:hypothetical protein
MSLSNLATNQWMQRLEEKFPERTVVLAPADAFFTHKVDLPAGLEAVEVQNFVALSLEAMAPFPIEQLLWGFITDPSGSHALAYAALRSRLKTAGITELETPWQLFPGFISLSGKSPTRACVRFLYQAGSLSALVYEAGKSVPSRVVSRALDGSHLEDSRFLAARKELLATLPPHLPDAEEGIWLGESPEMEGATPVFALRHLTEEASPPSQKSALSLSPDALWAADIRQPDYSEKEKQQRQRSGWIWRSLQTAAITALVLLILQVATFALGSFTKLQQGTITRLEPQATRIENKLTLANRLTQSTEEDLKPFLLLEAVNPLRPESVYLDKLRSRAFNELQLEGESNDGVTPVNAFADSVNQLSFVESVENNSRTRNNQTSFEFTIRFSELPPKPEGSFVLPQLPEEEEGVAPEAG